MVMALLFDEGRGVGLGHRRRMEALALELHARGRSCRLTAIDGDRSIAAALVVVDSYRVRADEMNIDAELVVAVDDLARDLAVGVVIDPSPGADGAHHRRAGRVLAGAQYALVAVPQTRVAVVDVRGAVTRVLVTTGAADAVGIGARIAAAVHAAQPEVDVRLVVGPWGATAVPDGVTGIVAPPTLADELAAAPIVVTAGGVSMLEACALGRAVVAVAIAENQRVAVDALTASGAVAPAAVDTVASVVAELVSDPVRRVALAAAAREAIDGRGPQRVAEELAR
ncbi:MAG: hypothetical protein SGJ13_07270 [Actinomycetota bacterium]|nr:hypothetical protein [Actinomycetota bacterium]